ncbi:MAG: ROK family protein, partial [Clostridia bacterium]
NGVVKEWYYAPQNANLDIESFVKEKLGVGVVVENDMKACAHAYSGNIATAQFGHNGIGIGIMVDGHVLRGQNGFAGEVGFIEDINRNIMSVRYCAKIIRALICFCNPSEIIFYLSERQNDFDKIMDEAMKKMPAYTKPKVVVSNDYIEDILKGLKILSINERTIDVSQVKFV